MLMKRKYKNLVWRYVRSVGRRPSSLLFSLLLIFLPNPTLSTPEKLFVPMLRETGVILSSPAAYPIHSGAPPPAISANAAYVVDVDSMVPLFVKNPDEPLPPASLTKIMTALVALDAFGDDRVLGARDDGPVIGKTIKLTQREQFSFSDLLYGLLLESGNDVALALGENYPGGYLRMVADMNQKAKKLGLLQSVFRNVSGIDENGHFISARDAAVLAIEAMRNDHFRTVVGTREKTVVANDGTTSRRFTNTNELVGVVPGVLGVKTGTTTKARECLVTFVERDGRRIVTVILGSRDRFLDTRNLIEWAFTNHEWKQFPDSLITDY